jgi:RHS repeat-associated protein
MRITNTGLKISQNFGIVKYGDNSLIRRFVYAPDGRVLGEYGGSAFDVRAEFIWMSPEVGGADMFGGDDGLGGYMPLAVAANDNAGVSQLAYVYASHMGVPIRYSDASGNTLPMPSSYSVPGFPGQSQTSGLAAADLYYNMHRDYDSSTGRYIQADPVGLDGGPSPYSYAMNNPLRYTDPSGKIVPLAIALAVIGGGTSFVVNAGAQYYAKGCVDWGEAGIAGGVGAVAGFLAPVAAPSLVGAIGLGGLSNVAQYGLTQGYYGNRPTAQGVQISALTGAIGGAFGGGVGRAPSGRSFKEAISDTGNPSLDRAINEAARMRRAVARSGLGRQVSSTAIGNIPSE